MGRKLLLALAVLLVLVAVGCVLIATWTVDAWSTPQRLLATAFIAVMCAVFAGALGAAP